MSPVRIPPTAWSSALIAALVGFGGTVALVVQAMQHIGASAAQIGSAITALCLGIAVAGAVASRLCRMPVLFAWSTPGAALIATSSLQLSWPVATGAFAAAALLMLLLGLVPWLGRLAARIPPAVASAMLAGVLLPFCLSLFRSLASDLVLAGALLLVFLVARQRAPLYALLLVLLAAFVIVAVRGDAGALPRGAWAGAPAPGWPQFDLRAFISLGLPLFLVTLSSQNLPGLMVLRACGYQPPAQPLLLGAGVASLLVAPFGAHSVNLAAITAALCTGADAHPDPARRWIVGLIYAGIYVLLALFSVPLVALFVAMPPATVAIIAGIAVIGPLSAALQGMLATPEHRDAAVLSFAATASGLSLWGIGAAFWGLVIGFAALAARALLVPKSFHN